MTIWMTRLARAATTLLVASQIGCGALDVDDPTAVQDDELNDAAGAELLRADALTKFSDAYGKSALRGGLMTDELFNITPSYFAFGQSSDENADRRAAPELLALDGGNQAYTPWQKVRRAASVALQKLVPYGSSAHAGEVYALRGYAELQLAEDFCAGFPLHELDGLKFVFGSPVSREQALERALADFDSGVTRAADSARVLAFAQIGRARALLALGRVAEAGAAVSDVALIFRWETPFIDGTGLYNPFNTYFSNQGANFSVSVADQEGGNGLDFSSATDPRLVVVPLGLTSVGARQGFEMAKYPTAFSPILVASGIEARLIAAEAALPAGGTGWLTILNDLRASSVAPPGLTILTDPGSDDARLDLLFRERAFWLFATGHRLGDLRRLVRLYGRDADRVFPTGPYWLGETYGTATTFPFPVAAEQKLNPAVTGCIGS